jgi:signal transduction histidine kinase
VLSNDTEKRLDEARADTNGGKAVYDSAFEAVSKPYEERIKALELQLEKRTHRLSLLQYLAEVFTTMPKPGKIAAMLGNLFTNELGAKTCAIWVKTRLTDTFQPIFGVGIDKEVWSHWKFPMPNPFPDNPMVLTQPQWFEKQALLPAMSPLTGVKDDLEPYYVPFEYQLELMGFALIGIVPDHPIEEEFDTLAVLRHQVGASLFNTNLLADLAEQRDEMKLKSEALEKSNIALVNTDRFKREFLTITSHELRTPLTGMLGLTRLVLDGLYEDEDDMLRMLQDSYASGKYLLKLLNDILDLAKIESGMFQVSLESASLHEIFKEVRQVVNGLPKAENVVVNLPDNLESLPKVIADPGRLHQVLVNLISNALKFTPDGSVSVLVEHGIGVVNFSIVDTGIGISPEDQQHLFQKFVQAEGGYSRHGGTGLGLSICKHLLEMMNSVITLHSDGEGCGTTIRFSIPIA